MKNSLAHLCFICFQAVEVVRLYKCDREQQCQLLIQTLVNYVGRSICCSTFIRSTTKPKSFDLDSNCMRCFSLVALSWYSEKGNFL